MDSDIKKIKRRKWRIQNKTDQPIEVVADNFNFLDYQDLTKIKIRISSFRANNYGLPTFIPKYLKNLYEIGYFNNKLNAFIPNIFNTVLSPIICDYIVCGFETGGDNRIRYFELTADNSEFNSFQPNIHAASSLDQYKNKYFWFRDTTNFLDGLTKTINDMINDKSSIANGCFFQKTPTSYALYVKKAFFDAGNVLLFNRSLIDLFGFKNKESIISTNFFQIIFNSEIEEVGGVDYYVVYSPFISDQWTSLSEIDFATTAQIIPISLYDEKSVTTTGFENVFLSFKINNMPYNYFNSAFTPDENWCTCSNSNTSEGLKISVKVAIRETGELMPYILLPDEVFEFVVEVFEYY